MADLVVLIEYTVWIYSSMKRGRLQVSIFELKWLSLLAGHWKEVLKDVILPE